MNITFASWHMSCRQECWSHACHEGCAQAFIDAHPGRTLRKKWVTDRVRELAEHNGRCWVLRAAPDAKPVANPDANPIIAAAPAPAVSGAAASQAAVQAHALGQAPTPDQAPVPSLALAPAQAGGPLDRFVMREARATGASAAPDPAPGAAELKVHELPAVGHGVGHSAAAFAGAAAGAGSSGGRSDADGGTGGAAVGAGTQLAAQGGGSSSGSVPSSTDVARFGSAGAGARSTSAGLGSAGGSGGRMPSDAELAAADDHVRPHAHSLLSNLVTFCIAFMSHSFAKKYNLITCGRILCTSFCTSCKALVSLCFAAMSRPH